MRAARDGLGDPAGLETGLHDDRLALLDGFELSREECEAIIMQARLKAVCETRANSPPPPPKERPPKPPPLPNEPEAV